MCLSDPQINFPFTSLQRQKWTLRPDLSQGLCETRPRPAPVSVLLCALESLLWRPSASWAPGGGGEKVLSKANAERHQPSTEGGQRLLATVVLWQSAGCSGFTTNCSRCFLWTWKKHHHCNLQPIPKATDSSGGHQPCGSRKSGVSVWARFQAKWTHF